MAPVEVKKVSFEYHAQSCESSVGEFRARGRANEGRRLGRQSSIGYAHWFRNPSRQPPSESRGLHRYISGQPIVKFRGRDLLDFPEGIR